MKIDDFRKLAAWQRANELRIMCQQLLDDPRVQRNFKFKDQLTDAAGSGPRNIAEGFGRFKPKQNAFFVRVAAGSAHEILDLFIEAKQWGYISAADFPRYETAARRAIGTIRNYLKYLDSCEDDGPDYPNESER